MDQQRSLPLHLALVPVLLALACPPAGAQQLLHTSSQTLALDDVEITPDQRWAVVRENRYDRYARVHDLATGAVAALIPGDGIQLLGASLDAVAVTNQRGVVLGGKTQILALDGPVPLLLVQHDTGYQPRDVAITPDGTIAAVRGGQTRYGLQGGLFLFDLASGAQIGWAPGEPPNYPSLPAYSFDVDGVALTDTHAVFTSIEDATTSRPTTRVTIFELRPAGPGSAPVVRLDTRLTPGAVDLPGGPHDVAITPDGLRAVVRSEYAVGIYSLAGPATGLLQSSRLHGNPGSFANQALDSVEAGLELAVTISNVASAPAPGQAQIDVLGYAGGHWSARFPGKPHDLALTPDGTRALVRTSTHVALFDLRGLLPGAVLLPADLLDAPAASTQYFAGLDSIVATDRFALVLTRDANLLDAQAWFLSIGGFRLELLSRQRITDTRPVDLVLTPDRTRAVVTGNSSLSVFHLPTGARSFEHHPVPPTNYYQWCDGVAAGDDKAVGVGQWFQQNGWIAVVDMTPFSQRTCASRPSSSGAAAAIGALGSARVGRNDLLLTVDGCPAGALGRFVYGTQPARLPFGDGVQCVGGAVFGLRTQATNVAGAAALAVDYAAQSNPAGVITPGSTWYFQFLFADPGSRAFGFNSSGAVGVTFQP